MKKYIAPEVYIVNAKESIMGPSQLDDIIMISDYLATDVQLGNTFGFDDEDDDYIDPWANVKGVNLWDED